MSELSKPASDIGFESMVNTRHRLWDLWDLWDDGKAWKHFSTMGLGQQNRATHFYTSPLLFLLFTACLLIYQAGVISSIHSIEVVSP